MTFELHHNWIEAGRLELNYHRVVVNFVLTYSCFGFSIRERDDRLQQLWTVVSQLPKANKDNLR